MFCGCVYVPTGFVYPFIGSGFVVCWGGIGAHFGVYIRSLGLVSWSVEDVFLWLVGVPMAIESLSGSWSAQVPERPTAVGSRLAYLGVWG